MNGLFTPVKIRNTVLGNRLVMPPMALDIAGANGEVTEQLLTHYLEAARAYPLSPEYQPKTRAGLGLVLVEHAYVSPEGRAHPRQLGICDDLHVSGLRALVKQLHAENVPVGIQLTHAGARAWHNPSAPSAIHVPCLKRYGMAESEDPEIPYELTRKEINTIVRQFAEAAVRAREAGFDIIEIHGAHGYLLNQFYSPLTNKRTDNYGGSLENRLRLPLEIIRAVRSAMGEGMSLLYRLGADDRLDGGNTVEDSMIAAPVLVEAGVDCLDLSGGLAGYIKSGPEGFFIYMAEAIKRVIDIPVLVTGGIQNPETADWLIAQNKTDLIGVGRAILADPDWARKAWKRLRDSHTNI